MLVNSLRVLTETPQGGEVPSTHSESGVPADSVGGRPAPASSQNLASHAPSETGNGQSTVPPATRRNAYPSPAANAAAPHPHRLCLRVPDLRGEKYLKTKNLIELFEGPTQVLLYNSEDKTYHRAGGVLYSEYVLREFRGLLGEENAVYQ